MLCKELATPSALRLVALQGLRWCQRTLILMVLSCMVISEQAPSLFFAWPIPASVGPLLSGEGGVGPLNLKYVAIISERHSGSTWMTRLLSEYFREKNITVTATLCTWKVCMAGVLNSDRVFFPRSELAFRAL